MASGSTPIYLIPYPLSSDPVDVHGDMYDMALQIEDVLYLKPDKNSSNIFTQPNIFNVSSASDAVRITQSGAGNALVVEDSSNPDTSAFVIDTSGNVAIGKTTASVKLDVVGAGAFSGAVTGSTFNALTLTAAATGFTIAGGTTSKTLTINNTLSFSGTDSTVMTFPSTNQTIAGLTSTQLFTNKSLSDSTTYIVDATDNTKRLQFDIAGTTGITGIFSTAFTTAKTVTFQDVAGTVYVTGGTDVSLADGGTGATLTASNGGIVYSTGSAMAILSGTATANQVLLSGSSTTPAWSTATYPATTTANQLLYSSAANTITGLATANSSVLVTNASGVPSLSTTLPAVTLTTPTIDTINISAAGTSGALWNTTMTTGSISMGGALTTGGVNIATGSAFNGTIAIATGAGTVNKTVNIGTSSTSGTTAITIGSSSGATSTVLLNGSVSTNGSLTVGGDLTVNGVTTTINTNTLTVDDKNLELGSVVSGTISTTGTIGTVSGTGPYTATISGMSSVVGLIPGQVITATAGTGNFGAGTMTVASIVSATSITVSSTATFTAGTVTNILGQGATNATADGGGITLKGTTDKTITWDSTNGNWTSNQPWNITSGNTFKINNVSVLSSTAVLGLTPTINATGYTLSGGTSAVAVTFAGGAAYTISGTNGQTYTMPSTGGTLIANPLTTLGDLLYGGASGAPTRLAGNTTNGTYFLRENVTASASVAPDWIGSTGSGNVVLATSPSLTTPTLGVASATSINKVTITTPATGSTLTIADGKTLTASNTITFTATDGSTLAIGGGGTLGSAAYTSSTAYEPAITTLAISKGGTGTGTAPTQYGVIYASSTTAYASTAAGTNTQVLIGNASGAPSWTNISGLSVSSATTATNLSGTTQYSIPYQSASATTSYLSIGSANQVLAVNGTATGYVWSTPFTNPMTTLGDMVYGGASGVSTRLANAGTTNGVYILQETVTGGAATAPSWLGTTGTGNVVLVSSPTITTPTIDVINAASATGTTQTLFGNTTSGTINIGGSSFTTGIINIGTAGSSTNSINMGNANTTVTVNGNLTVNGTTTTVNSVTITVDDPNIELNSVASPSDANAAGGGITLKATNDKSIVWQSTATTGNTTNTGYWNLTDNLNLNGSAKAYYINGTSVLSSTAVLGITPTINATGFSLAGGTSSKSLTVQNNITLSGTDGVAINLGGTSGTLGTGAFATIANYAALAGATFTGQIQSTLAGVTTTGGGQLYLNGATSNRIDFNTNGTAAPTFTTRSTGTKIVLYPNVGGASVDYAIGIENGSYWESITDASSSFKWYAGTTAIATLSGAGALTANSFVKSGGTSAQYLMADGSVTTAVVANAGALTGTTLASNVINSSLTSLGTLTSLTVSGLATLGSISVTGSATFTASPTVPTPTNNTDAVNKAYVDSVLAGGVPAIIPLDDLSGQFNDLDSRFLPTYQGTVQSITNPLRLVLTINGIIQYVDFPDYVWQSPLPREGFQIDNDGYIAFSEVVPAGSRFDARIMPGPTTQTEKRGYPFKAVDILLGG